MARLLTKELDAKLARAGEAQGDHPTPGQLLLVRADSAPGTDQAILDVCSAHGVPLQAANRAGQPGEWFVMAIEVPADAPESLAPQLRALPGVIEVSVTQVGRPAASASGASRH